MGLYEHLFQESKTVVEKIPDLIKNPSNTDHLKLKFLKKQLQAAVLLVALDMPKDNPGSKDIIHVYCEVVHRVGDEKFSEYLKAGGLYGEHAHKEGGFLICKDEKLVNEVAPIFMINQRDEKLNLDLGKRFGYAPCCIKAYTEGKFEKRYPNETMFQFLHDARECSPNCEHSSKVIRGRITYLSEEFHELFGIVRTVLFNFEKGVYIPTRPEPTLEEIKMQRYFERSYGNSFGIIPEPNHHLFTSNRMELEAIGAFTESDSREKTFNPPHGGFL